MWFGPVSPEDQVLCVCTVTGLVCELPEGWFLI